LLLALVFGSIAFATAVDPLDGIWVGTEVDVDHTPTDPGSGTHAATITMKGGSGIYSIGPSKLAAEEYDGSFFRGNLTKMDGERHGTVMLYARGTKAYGSFFSYGSKRMFHWEFNRSGPVAPTPPPTPPLPPPGTIVYDNPSDGYSCFRVPSVVNTGMSILVFVESRRSSCGDQEPKDVNLRRSTDGGETWGPLIHILGNALTTNHSHQTYRNPTALYHTLADGSSVVLLNVVNSTSGAGSSVVWPSLQLRSYDDGLTWTKPERLQKDMGKWEGVLAGPGAC
jgi:hypothetical protein